MIDELVYPKDITPETLYLLLQSVYIDCELDEDGDLFVTDPLPFFVIPGEDSRDVRLRAGVPGLTDIPLDEKVRVVNRFNRQKKMIRAAVDDDGDISFDYYLVIDGGITKANIVRSIRLFSTILGLALFDPKLSCVIA